MFEPENDLEKSLSRAYKDTATRSSFYKDLLESEIYVITNKPLPLDEKGHLKTGARVSFERFEHEGARFLPIFSSFKRLQDSIKNQVNYTKLNARRFFEITRGETVILNPGLELGKVFTPPEIADMLDGKIFAPRPPEPVGADIKSIVGQPLDYPNSLVEALTALFKEDPDVKTAYLSMVVTSTEDEEPQLMIAIDSSGDWPALANSAQSVAAVHMPGESIYFIRMDDSPICQHILKHVKPFYTRKET